MWMKIMLNIYTYNLHPTYTQLIPNLYPKTYLYPTYTGEIAPLMKSQPW